MNKHNLIKLEKIYENNESYCDNIDIIYFYQTPIGILMRLFLIGLNIKFNKDKSY